MVRTWAVAELSCGMLKIADCFSWSVPHRLPLSPLLSQVLSFHWCLGLSRVFPGLHTPARMVIEFQNLSILVARVLGVERVARSVSEDRLVNDSLAFRTSQQGNLFGMLVGNCTSPLQFLTQRTFPLRRYQVSQTPWKFGLRSGFSLVGMTLFFVLQERQGMRRPHPTERVC